MRAKKPGERWEYILKADMEKEKPKSERTVFNLMGLNHEDYFSIQNLNFTEGIGSGNMATLSAGIVGWSNMQDEDGNEISFKLKDERCHPDMLDLIVGDPAVVVELVNAIRSRSKMDDGEQKNSSSEGA